MPAHFSNFDFGSMDLFSPLLDEGDDEQQGCSQLILTRSSSDAAASLGFPVALDEMDDIFDDRELASLTGDELTTVTYSSSEESHNAEDRVSSSSSASLTSSEDCSEKQASLGGMKRKRAPATKRTPAGLSAQEKRELRKMRNRELAAESRKRKNDELERLRQENALLKQRIVALEKNAGVTTGITAGQPQKRTRGLGTTVTTSSVVASLAAFVVTGPADHSPGVSSTASILVTALDFSEGQVLGFLQMMLMLAVSLLVTMLAGKVVAEGARQSQRSIMDSLRGSFSSKVDYHSSEAMARLAM